MMLVEGRLCQNFGDTVLEILQASVKPPNASIENNVLLRAIDLKVVYPMLDIEEGFVIPILSSKKLFQSDALLREIRQAARVRHIC
jgi:hypothetical protein